MSNVKTDSIKATETETKANAGDELTDGQLDGVAGGSFRSIVGKIYAAIGGGSGGDGGGNGTAGVRG
jgi:hypothetical protein